MTNKPRLTKAQREALEMLDAAGQNGAWLDRRTYDYGASFYYGLTVYFIHSGVARRLQKRGYAHIITWDWNTLAYITDKGREALQ